MFRRILKDYKAYQASLNSAVEEQASPTSLVIGSESQQRIRQIADQSGHRILVCLRDILSDYNLIRKELKLDSIRDNELQKMLESSRTSFLLTPDSHEDPSSGGFGTEEEVG